MRVLHVSWEYPPIVYGGLGRHVHALSTAQAQRGDDVIVLTQAEGGESSRAEVDGVTVVRAPHDPPGLPFTEEHLLTWVLAMQTGMIRTGLDLGVVDVVHAHDWVTAHAAVTLRDALGARCLVSTIHATEAGRHQGWLPGPLSDSIHSIEHWLVQRSDGVIACSRHMSTEIEQLFGPSEGRVSVIANGIDVDRWQATPVLTARARAAHAGSGPLVVFVGRLEWEKGAHTLVDALPRLRRRLPGVRAVIAGRGGLADGLEAQVRKRRARGAVDFVGWLPEPELHALIAAADVLVVPSIYEPFGLVALEGAAIGTPLAVARTGGLAEFVEAGVTGHVFEPGDVPGLASAIVSAVEDPVHSRLMADEARRRLRASYGWSMIAADTHQAYERAMRHPRPDGEPRPASIPERSVNLLGL